MDLTFYFFLFLIVLRTYDNYIDMFDGAQFKASTWLFKCPEATPRGPLRKGGVSGWHELIEWLVSSRTRHYRSWARGDGSDSRH